MSPTLPLPKCKIPTCNETSVARGRPYCQAHIREDYKVQQRFSNDPFYSSPEWKNVRASYGSRHPICEQCERNNIIVPRYCVDHIVPRSLGGSAYSEENLQALCRLCHDKKRTQERQQMRQMERGTGTP